MLRSLARQFQALSVSAARSAPVRAAPRLQMTRALSTAALPPFASPLLARRAAVAPPKPLVPVTVMVPVRHMGYKLKTKSAVKKRFKVNCNGLVKRAQANKRHIATKKTRERIRRLGKPVFLEGKIRKNVLSLLNK